MKKTIWDMNDGDFYYCLAADGRIYPMVWTCDYFDEKRRESFNAFLTKEEAEAELKERKKKAQASKLRLDRDLEDHDRK